MTNRATAHLQFNIDEENIKTLQVRTLIFELIKKITTITETFPLENGINPESLVISVERAVARFLQIGDQALRKCTTTNKEVTLRLQNALEDVDDCGKEMGRVGRNFIRDSSSNQKRAEAVAAGRGLLEAVAQLLILADMLDIALVVDNIGDALHLLHQLRNSSSNNEVIQRYDQMMAHIEEIEHTVRKRICELLDPVEQDDLIAAMSTLKMACPLVKQSTVAFVRHPESEESRRNRDYAHGMVQESLVSLQNLLNGNATLVTYSELGHLNNLATKLDEFRSKVFLDPNTLPASDPRKYRPEFERLVEEIASGSGRLCDSDTTRVERKNAIITGCNALRQALQDLLNEYEQSSTRGKTDDLDTAQIQVSDKEKYLRRQLRRCVVDHVSDAFLDIYTPLLALVEERDPERVREFARTFLLHADKMCEVALLACEMSTNVEGVRNIRLLATQLHKLAPEVVNAAILLSTHRESEVARQNMEDYKCVWAEKVQLLTNAIDSIISLDDFLAVSESHINDDALRGNDAVNRGDCELLDQSAGAIRGRGLRVCAVVDEEMEFASASSYDIERIRQATRILREKSVPQFTASAEHVLKNVEESIIHNTRTKENIEQDSGEFIDACSQILHTVKEIRNALLLNRNPDDVDSDNDYEDDGQTIHDTNSKISESDNQQKLMRQLPAEDKIKIQKEIDVFKITQSKFETEVAKWDDNGNDIIMLAKHMSMIMNNMADFTRGRGPYKTTLDVIKAAQDISVAGSKLNALAKQIADESADSLTKTDLYSYMNKIPTFCQQLNICSKVKADVQMIEEGSTEKAVDSATSLVQTARNLLSTVVSTVKCAYIASTKFRRPNTFGPRVEWKMAPPLKQPLVRPQKTTGVIRRASERRPLRPAQVLAEFTH